MTLRRLIEIGAMQYDKFDKSVKQVYDLMLLGMILGEIPNEVLDKELSEEDLNDVPETQKKPLINSLNFIEKFYNIKNGEKNVLKCSELSELNGKKCGNFTLEVTDLHEGGIEVKVNSYFEGMQGYMNVYEVVTDNMNYTTETVIKDLKTFGFSIELEDKEEEISYRDKTTGKLVGIIKHKNGKLVQAKLGKFKYINLAEMFKEFDKDIDKFNKELEHFSDLEIIK